jgi:hypothetical protein
MILLLDGAETPLFQVERGKLDRISGKGSPLAVRIG